MQPRLTVVGAHRAPQRVARSTMIVMAATLASMVLGFGREVLNARYFGASGDMDAFLAATVCRRSSSASSTAPWSARSFRSSPNTT